MMETVNASDLEAAHARIRGIANRTPVMTSRQFNQRTGATAFFKCENFQRAGAFKFRGAYNAISQLNADQKTRGVVTFSSGNHAQAIALAGTMLGVKTTIVMPNNSPVVKQRATREYGGEVILYDPEKESREELGRELAEQRGLTMIPPYDHPHIIAGQGTAARELIEEAGELDMLAVPCGGGGLISGCAIAAHKWSPQCRVVGVEPEAGDDATRSFKSGTLQKVHNPQTIADGARTPCLGKYTFPLVLQHVADMVTVTDDELVETMFFLWERMKMIVEPTGALAAAAVLHGKMPVSGKRIGIIISGGNIDLQYAVELFSRRNRQS